MVQEVILCGFKVQVPLTPEDQIQIEKIAVGLSKLETRVAQVPRFLTRPEDLDIMKGAAALRGVLLCLLDASRAAAGRSSKTARS